MRDLIATYASADGRASSHAQQGVDRVVGCGVGAFGFIRAERYCSMQYRNSL